MNLCATRYFTIAASDLVGGTKTLPTASADGVPSDYIRVLHGLNAYIVPDAVDEDIVVAICDSNVVPIVEVGKYFTASQADTLAVNWNGIPLYRAKAGIHSNSFIGDIGGAASGDLVTIQVGTAVSGTVTVYYSWQPRASLRN